MYNLNVRRVPGVLYNHRYICVSIVIVISTIFYLLLRWSILCTNLETWHHVQRACRSYKQGVAAGSLCRPLCESSSSSNGIRSLRCHSFRQGKVAVFSAEWHRTRARARTKLVFKTSRTIIETESLHWYNNGIKTYPTESDFQSLIRGLVFAKFNMTITREQAARLSRLKPAYEEANIDGDVAKRQREMENVWPLMQDNEYLLASLFTDRDDVFPQLLGTCGHYFALEYLEPVRHVSVPVLPLPSINPDRNDWNKRVKLAIRITELLEALEDVFHEPLHLCDIKFSHFGMTKDRARLKYIDLAAVYPRSVVNKIIRSTAACSSDQECDFYDCRARCDSETHKCASVANNNMQVVCEKLFLGWTMNSKVLVPGLLISEHTPSSLAAVLRQCANPDSEATVPRASTPKHLGKRLYNILTEIEQTLNNNFIL